MEIQGRLLGLSLGLNQYDIVLLRESTWGLLRNVRGGVCYRRCSLSAELALVGECWRSQ